MRLASERRSAHQVSIVSSLPAEVAAIFSSWLSWGRLNKSSEAARRIKTISRAAPLIALVSSCVGMGMEGDGDGSKVMDGDGR